MIVQRFAFFGCVVLLAALLVGYAKAGPVIPSIGDGGELSWTEAVELGFVRAVQPSEYSPAELQAYQSVANDLGLFEVIPQTTLIGNDHLDKADVIQPDISGLEKQSLVMIWNNDQALVGEGVLTVGGFQYDFDPDLTDGLVNFSIQPPSNISGASLTLISGNGGTRQWLTQFPAGGNGTWMDETIIANLAANQGAPNNALSWVYQGDSGNFDITNVVSFRFSEFTPSGRSAARTPNVPNLPTDFAFSWNAWDHVRVAFVPEPATASAFMVIALAALRWRQNRFS